MKLKIDTLSKSSLVNLTRNDNRDKIDTHENKKSIWNILSLPHHFDENTKYFIVLSCGMMIIYFSVYLLRVYCCERKKFYKKA